MASRLLADQGDRTLRRRRLLRISVKLAVLAGVAAFAVVFLQGLVGPARVGGEVIELAGIPPGQARLEAWEGRPVWILSRSEAQIRALAAGAVDTPDPDTPGPVDNVYRSLDRRYGVYLAETARQGVLVQYLRERPDRLAAESAWHGGFIDPGSGALFDAAGRGYGGTAPRQPLAVPPHRLLGDDAVRLGEW